MVVEFLIKPHRALASNASSVLLNNRGEGMGGDKRSDTIVLVRTKGGVIMRHMVEKEIVQEVHDNIIKG